MQGVGYCECGISSDIAHGVVKDHLLGYVSLSNHPYRPHVADGVASQVTNCDWFIRETSKGVVPVRNIRDIDRAPIEPFIGYSGQLRERLEDVRQPLSCAQVW
jgi:hypothetical protein